MAEERDIKYTNKDFAGLKQQLISLSKSYFPDTYNDFSPASPGMLFMEQAAYVGDVLSFYQDIQVQETFLQFAEEKQNLYNLAYMMGYQPKTTGLAEVPLTVFQRVPAKTVGGQQEPDFGYAVEIAPNLTVKSNDGAQVPFYVPEAIDFSFSSSYSPTEVSVYATEYDSGTGQTTITEFLLTKKVKAYSGNIATENIAVGDVQQFFTTTLTKGEREIAGILEVVDSSSNTWKEVPYLGQDTVFVSSENTNSDNGLVLNKLTLQPQPRRFVTRYNTNGDIILQFGAGSTGVSNDTFVPNPITIGDANYGGISGLDIAYDPTNMLFSDSYGLAPSNTTLTIKYIEGYGVAGNVRSNTLTSIVNIGADYKNPSITDPTYRNSVAVTNETAAQGGKDGDTPEEIRLNAMAAFNAQRRAVTRSDYSIRALSLPPKYGSVAKAFTAQNQLTGEDFTNPLALSLYVLAYDNNRNLTTATTTLKENIKTYLSEFKMLSDALDIRDAYIVNIGVSYEIVLLPEYNSREVLLKVQEVVKDFFDINKWTINQPIEISKLYTVIDRVKGVQSAENINITNKYGGSYSDVEYDLSNAVKKNVIYPSYDPMIFEVKFPDRDIVGRITTI